MITCPYCKKTYEPPDYVVRNAECYGGGTVRFKCDKCHQVIMAIAIVIVKLDNVQKTDKPSDWP